MFRSSKTDQHHYQANNKHAAYRNNAQMSTTITTTSPPRALRLNTSLGQKFVASSGAASRLSSSPPPRSVVSSSSTSSSSSSPTTAKLSNSTEQTPIIGAGGPRQIQPRLISGSTRFAHNGTTAATTTNTTAKSFLGDSNNTCGPYQELSPPPSGRPYRRLKPLTVQEYETKFRTSASDLELVERIYAGSMSCNQLRAALWPYLLGIITHRGRFERICSPEGRQGWLFVEHEANKLRWRDLQRKYETYQGQWRSILPEQEPRFSTFRERKSLIETDVIRCDRLHPFYGEDSANLAKLTNLLMTYMMYDFDIGYLQGMSDIAAPILYVMQGDLVKSFWVFVEVMKLFRRNFEASQKTIHFQLNCLYRLIKLTDRKFAHYLGQNECSNCFFAFRCIVCQFKRELMKCNGDKQAENEHENDDDDDLFENNHRDDENINQNGHPKAHNYDYSNVLKLWDTIWCVQRRHELLSRNKCTHTFTIANGAHSDNNYKLSANHQLHRHTNNNNNNNNRNRSPTHSSPSPTSSTARLMRHQQDHSAPNGTPTTKTHTNNQQSESSPKSRTQQQNHNHTYSHNNQQQHHRNNASGHLNHHHHHNHHQNGTSNGQNGSAGLTNGHHNNAHQTTTSGTKTTNGFSTSNSSPNFASHRQHSITSIRSNGSTSGGGGGGPASPTFGPSLIGSYQQQQINLINGCSDRLSPLSVSLASVSINNSPSMNGSADSNSHHNGCCKQTTQQPVKQEQIVYTKETFYSSFDPNQADVPRFELTETEKFMLSLCLSMIRRERNNILLNRMDATEIHQLFINPHLACDLDDFINQAYEIYTYLNTDCDLQRVVKGANEFSANGTTGGAGLGANNLAATATTNGSDLSPVTNIGIDIQSEPGSWPKDSADTADTYDLLKDYLIISPHSYNTSASSTLAHNNLIGSINYIGSNRHQNSHHIIDNNNHHHKPWDHFIDNSPPT